jgi:hypothetical protein
MDNFNPNQMPPVMGEPHKKSMGPLLAVIIILALIIVGGLYLLKKQTGDTYSPNQSDAVVDSLSTQNESDDLDSIEADLNATIIDNLDQGASVIEADL